MYYNNNVDQLKGELMVLKGVNVKPNFAALGRKYCIDWRTVKKYYEGYDGKTKKGAKRAN